MHFNVQVPAGEIVEWLVARKRVPKQWVDAQARALPQLREGLETAGPAFKAAFESVKNSDAHVGDAGYVMFESAFNAMMSSLKSAGQAGKSLFGSYNHPELLAWDALLTAYRNNAGADTGNLHWVDLGRTLARLVTYEIPSLRRECAFITSHLADLSRRRAEASSKAEEDRKALAAYKEELGVRAQSVTDSDFRGDLLAAAAKELPPAYATAAGAACQPKLLSAVHLYSEYRSFIASPSAGADKPIYLPALTAVAKAIQVGSLTAAAYSSAVQRNAQASLCNNPSNAISPLPIGVPDLSVEAQWTGLLNDALELRSFLAARLLDASAAASDSAGGADLLDPFAGAPASLSAAACDKQALKASLVAAHLLVGCLSSSRAVHLQAIATRSEALDRAVHGLIERQRQYERLMAKVAECEEAREAAARKQAHLSPLLATKQTQARELAARLEQEVTASFDGKATVRILLPAQ